jgi:cell division protein ZapA (FtsZ GTPase activity inhibitor)
VGKNRRKFRVTYPDEKEFKIKDANRKLKAQVKSLKRIIKTLESENKTLQRAFNKSCDFIQKKLSNKSLKQILKEVDDFDYKETEKGREKEEKKKEEKKIENSCPKCLSEKNFKTMEFENFIIKSCKCGYRKKESKD